MVVLDPVLVELLGDPFACKLYTEVTAVPSLVPICLATRQTGPR